MQASVAGPGIILRLSNTVFLSIVFHGAALLLAGWVTTSDHHGLAKPPVSSIHARIFTYQKSESVENAELKKSSAVSHESISDFRALKNDEVKVSGPTAATLPARASGVEAIADSASLDSSPTLISPVTLEYPLSANNREGIVTLALVIGVDGRVVEASVVNANPAGFFDAAALSGFEQAQFIPGMAGGIYVKSRMLIEVEFMPTNRGGTVAGPK